MRNVYNSPTPAIPTDFDDLISSFQLIGNRVEYPLEMINRYEQHYGAVVTFYKDLNYKSSSRSFVIDVNSPQISCNNFKNIDFNDEVTSMEVHWFNRQKNINDKIEKAYKYTTATHKPFSLIE